MIRHAITHTTFLNAPTAMWTLFKCLPVRLLNFPWRLTGNLRQMHGARFCGVVQHGKELCIHSSPIAMFCSILHPRHDKPAQGGLKFRLSESQSLALSCRACMGFVGTSGQPRQLTYSEYIEGDLEECSNNSEPCSLSVSTSEECQKKHRMTRAISSNSERFVSLVDLNRDLCGIMWDKDNLPSNRCCM